MMTANKCHHIANIIGLFGVTLLLFLTFFIQFMAHELPCPLCLLQRVGFVAVGICFCMNLKFGIKPSHYGLMGLAALLAFMISLRQIFLHIAPDDPGYGTPVLGIYLYVWSAILLTLVLACISIGLLLEDGFRSITHKLSWPVTLLIALFLLLILADGISTLIECGFYICPANPVQYDL